MRWPRAHQHVYPGESIADVTASAPKRGVIITLMPGTHLTHGFVLRQGVALRGWMPWWRRVIATARRAP